MTGDCCDDWLVEVFKVQEIPDELSAFGTIHSGHFIVHKYKFEARMGVVVILDVRSYDF